jgi:hypothetical protein
VNEAPPLSTFAALLARLEAAVVALEEQTPDDPLDVAAVRTRYGLADDRSARKVMHEAGAFLVGGRLFVPRCNLERLEASRVERASSHAGARRVHHDQRPHDAADLEPGFWR